MKKLLTVAVPAYNMELLIRDCLDTVIDDRVEVLIVDDGSSDNTNAIARMYCEQYPDIFKLFYKPDGCWGYAINRTIKEASGEYYVNLDSDDWFLANGFKKLLENIENHKTDLIVAPGYEHSMKTGKEWPIQFPKNIEFGKEQKFSDISGSLDFFFTVHSLIVKTEILQKNSIQIDECYYADMELLSYPMPYINTIFAQKEPLYIYRVDREGQSVSLKSRAKNIDKMETVAQKIMQWFSTQTEPNMKYYRMIATTVIYAWLTAPFVLDADAQNAYIPKLREFKTKYIDSNNQLKDYGQYGLFAKVLLKGNFNKYAMWASLWRLSMNNRGISSVLWSLLHK